MDDDAVEQARAAAEAAAAAAAAARAAADEAVRLAEDAARRADELAAAVRAGAEAPVASGAEAPVASGAEAPIASGAQPAVVQAVAPAPEPTGTAAPPAPETAAPPAPASAAPLDADAVALVRQGYQVTGSVLELGALVNGDALPDVQIRIPLGMLNRHGLVAGATGTGKTRTLQLLAEQIAAAGVPVFAADVKGDLSGLGLPGTPNDRLLDRTTGIGQDWSPAAVPVELYSLGGQGTGVPIRATVSGFGPLLLAKVLGLNHTQESSLGLVFHHAERAGLPLVDLTDLRSVLTFLTSAEGKADLAELGGLSKQTAGVILRELITFADAGADQFFGEPEIDTRLFLRTAADGPGIVSLLEVPGVQDRPQVFSTFLMWLLADLFNELPEVGDRDRPELVFFFDEAHLLFDGASKDFRDQIVRTVRLIRSKGVGIVFVTQSPEDLPSEVLAQLGSRIQHQLRAHTPDDAKALRAAVSTYPTSDYDLAQVLTSLATGEAIVTVMDERGAPTPVAWTRLRAPRGSMDPMPADVMQARVDASPLLATYGTRVDPDSAHEMLARRLEAAAAQAAADDAAEVAADAAADAERADANARVEASRRAAADAKREAKERAAAQAEYEKAQRDIERADRAAAERRSRSSSRSGRSSTSRASGDPLSDLLGGALGSSLGRSIAKEVVRGVFSTLRRRR